MTTCPQCRKHLDGETWSHACSRPVFTLDEPTVSVLKLIPVHQLAAETKLDVYTVRRALSGLPHKERSHAILMRVCALHRAEGM